MGLQEKLKDFAAMVEAKIEDLATIEVATFTGQVVIDGTWEPKATTVYNHLKGAGSAQLQFVAMTRIELDMDAANFVATNADQNLVKLHNEAVRAAIDARTAVFELAKGLLKVI